MSNNIFLKVNLRLKTEQKWPRKNSNDTIRNGIKFLVNASLFVRKYCLKHYFLLTLNKKYINKRQCYVMSVSQIELWKCDFQTAVLYFIELLMNRIVRGFCPPTRERTRKTCSSHNQTFRSATVTSLASELT